MILIFTDLVATQFRYENYVGLTRQKYTYKYTYNTRVPVMQRCY